MLFFHCITEIVFNCTKLKYTLNIKLFIVYGMSLIALLLPVISFLEYCNGVPLAYTGALPIPHLYFLQRYL